MAKINTGGQKKCKHTHTHRKKESRAENPRHVRPNRTDFCTRVGVGEQDGWRNEERETQKAEGATFTPFGRSQAAQHTLESRGEGSFFGFVPAAGGVPRAAEIRVNLFASPPPRHKIQQQHLNSK
ncbi:UNVERIFIED_CONTAM: hypothetical protein K2H54_052410 [Gekko kuhli]